MSLTPDQNRFADDIIDILGENPPRFDFARIANQGLRRGLVHLSEADRMRSRGVFPDWLSTALRQRLNLPMPPLAQTAVTQQELVPAAHITTPPPATVPGTLWPEASYQTETYVHPMILCEGGPSRHLLRNFTKLMLDADGRVDGWSDPGADIFAPFLTDWRPRQLPGHSMLCMVEGATVYLHWLLDTLPRLLWLIEAGHDLARYDSFYFTDTSAAFHQATLDMLGIPMDKVFDRIRHGPSVSLESFDHVTAPRNAQSTTHPGNHDLLRRFFLGPTDTQTEKGRRLYISRGKAARRRIVNEDELSECLSRHGFETVRLEDFSIAQTARLIAGASHVIAPHGAGLSNLVFATPGAKVLEIFGAHLTADCWRICGQRGLDYLAMQGLDPEGRRLSPERLAQMPRHDRNGMDILVDIAALQPVLDNFL